MTVGAASVAGMWLRIIGELVSGLWLAARPRATVPARQSARPGMTG